MIKGGSKPMKKYIAIILLSAFILSCSVAVYASEEGSSHGYTPGDDATLDQTITAVLPENAPEWYLEIPADVTIEKGGYIDGHIDIGKVKIIVNEEKGTLQDGQQIEAYLKYDGILTASADGSSYQLAYNLSPKSPTYSGVGEEYDTWTTNTLYKIGIKSKSDESISAPDAWITLEDWAAAQEGEYEGTVVYSSTLKTDGE